MFLYFNTSYVTVQRKEQELVTNIPENFNTSYVTVQLPCLVFFSVTALDFNTSYVTVQLRQTLDTIRMQDYFNTSYVTVQRIPLPSFDVPVDISIHLMLRFNSCTYAFYISHHIK